MILVPDGSSLTDREWKCPASTTGTCPSNGGTAYGSCTAATATGCVGWLVFQAWTTSESRPPARTSGSDDAAQSGRGEADGDAAAVGVPDVPGVLVGVGGGFAGTDGLGSGSMGALASGVNLGSPMPARTRPLTTLTSPSSTIAFGFCATAACVRSESWLPRTKT